MNLTLDNLDIDATDVCPPLDEDYQAWLRTIPRAYGLYCPSTQIERYALIEFYAKTGGDSWTNNDGWGSASVGDNWYGITVGDSLVQQLRLPNNGLEGPLPPEITTLLALETLDLDSNELAGEFPDAITTMDALDTISVGSNAGMEGPLPSDMIEMTALKALQFAGTDLCSPPTSAFKEWRDSLDIAEGATCGNPDSVRLSLPVVYLTQAIQRTEGDVSLLSGRDALLRVFLVGDQENAFFEPEVFATFTRNGDEVFRVVMPSEHDRLATDVDEGSLVKSYNAVIPAEHIVTGTGLVVVADSAEVVPHASGSQTRYPDTGEAALDVIEVPPMELTVVPVLEAEDPDSSVLEWTDGIDGDSPKVGQFKHSFPLSEFSASSWDTAYVTSLDLSEDPWSLVLELEKLRKNEDATGYWYGAALSNNGFVRGTARVNGWVGVGKPEGPELAHEVGHLFSLRHTPCGDPDGLDPDFPYRDGSVGVGGFDFRDSSLVSPRRPDVMGYCYNEGSAWLSDYHFEKAIDARQEKEGDDPDPQPREGAKGQMLVLWGGVVNGEPRIEPVHPMFTSPKLPEGTGPYRLEGLGHRTRGRGDGGFRGPPLDLDRDRSLHRADPGDPAGLG